MEPLMGLLVAAICSEPRKKYVTIPEQIAESRKKSGLPPLPREEMQEHINLIMIDKERARVQRLFDAGML